MTSIASETLSTERMPYVHWLNLRHEPDDPYYELAHLVLSGGPDNMWAARFDLMPQMVYNDVQLLYAAGRHGVTAEHVELARTARDEYYDNAPTVAEAVMTRHQYSSTGQTERNEVIDAMRKPYADAFSEVEMSQASARNLVPQVTDADGDDTSYQDKSLPAVRTSHTCTHVDPDTAVACRRNAPPGNTVCTRHGGRLYTDVELKNIHRTTKEKLLAASEAAVDNLVNLLDSTNDMVRLKAAEAILDRTGFVPGVEVQVSHQGPDRTPAQIIEDRLARLAEGVQVEQIPRDPEPEATDAEIVEEE